MLVTINTDASFCPHTKVGAYAFWAISNTFKITKSGVFRNKCANPNDAEARCICNALKMVLANDGVTRVIVNTDSLNAIALLKGDKTHIRRYMGANMEMWKHIRVAYHEARAGKPPVEIEFRHVKAHSGVNDRRRYVNEWCDTEAKKQLRSQTKPI